MTIAMFIGICNDDKAVDEFISDGRIYWDR